MEAVRRRGSPVRRPAVVRVAVGYALVVAGLLAAPPGLEAQRRVAFEPGVYAARRARLAAAAGEGAAVIVPGRHLIRPEGQVKQDPNFWYLTGVESPYAILVLGPSREVLFLPRRYQFAGAQYPMVDERFRRARWNRPLFRLEPGPEAERETGIAETLPVNGFARHLPSIVGDAPVVHFVRDGEELYAPPGLGRPLSIRQQLEREIRSLLPDREFADGAPLVERLRLVKDEHEIRALRRAAEISVLGLREAMEAIRPGANDLEIAGLMEYVWKREGSPRPSFEPIVASGESALTLYSLRAERYQAVDRAMRAGELVFIDYGAAEWETYTSDVCRTYPVSGRFTPEQRRYYEIVLEAQEAALARIRPGVPMLDVIRAAAEIFRSHGLEAREDIERMGADRVWGVMPSPTHYLAREGGIVDYSARGGIGVRDLGHHIGLEALDSRDWSGPLEPGMVFTVEPKIYIPEKTIAIMIEDVVLVTEDGHENLSAGAPKDPDEIERIMGGAP